ncbi:MAG: helix-turn-helix domain-containing protein [Tolumonas sp.]
MTAHLRIAIVAYERVLPSALYGLGEVFAAAERFRERGDRLSDDIVRPLEWRYLLAGQEALTSSLPCWQTDDSVDVVILPPCSAGQMPVCPDWLFAWLHKQHQQGAVLASACAGACVLAQSGLLDGRIITTHWLLEETFRLQFPHIRLNLDAVVIEEADLMTAGGLMAWLDLAMRIVRRYYGAPLVAQLSKYLLWDSGEREQRYYRRFQPPKQHGDMTILKLQQWLEVHFPESCSLPQLAGLAAMSVRTLQRRFQMATKLTIGSYLQHLRLEKARELLETTMLSVEQIIGLVGYDDRSSFNKLFKTQTGLSPKDYRQRFNG